MLIYKLYQKHEMDISARNFLSDNEVKLMLKEIKELVLMTEFTNDWLESTITIASELIVRSYRCDIPGDIDSYIDEIVAIMIDKNLRSE